MAEQKLVLPPEEELEEVFVRTASGPGGQNVNKTSTAVRLVYRFMESDFLQAGTVIKCIIADCLHTGRKNNSG